MPAVFRERADVCPRAGSNGRTRFRKLRAFRADHLQTVGFSVLKAGRAPVNAPVLATPGESTLAQLGVLPHGSEFNA
jgi:hypothetical protein